MYIDFYLLMKHCKYVPSDVRDAAAVPVPVR